MRHHGQCDVTMPAVPVTDFILVKSRLSLGFLNALLNDVAGSSYSGQLGQGRGQWRIGQEVGHVIATDPNLGQTLTYNIISGNIDNAFEIGSNSGILSVTNSSILNYEESQAFDLLIEVQDDGVGNLTDQATITVNLNDINEVPEISDQSFELNENSPNGQEFGTLVATDPDNGQSLTYSIIDGNIDNAFNIGSSSGILSVSNRIALNFEVNPVFNLIVQVQDDGTGNLTDEGAITVTLNDVNEVPVIFEQSFVIEETIGNGEFVGSVIATDPDVGQTLGFSIIGGNPENVFQIDQVSGEITIADNSALDFNTNPVYYLIVQVQDDGQGNLENQAVISVSPLDVNQVPNITNQSFSIEENSPVGQEVGQVIASDPDIGQTLTYSIISGNTDNTFLIGSTSGILSVANSTILNYEENQAFDLIVQVQDDGVGTLTNQASVTVNLTDINEVPEINDQTYVIDENSSDGVQVGTVIATDPDNGQTLAYSIIAGNTDNAFQLDPVSGMMAVATSSVLDFETYPDFNITIEVQDNGNGNLSDQATITVNLNDINEAPTINDESFALDENSPNGQQLGTLIATDPDNGQTLTYNIISGNTNNAFELGSTSGILSINNTITLDFESNPVFILTIEVHDNGLGSLNDQATVTVNLNDINEDPIIYNQIFIVEETIGTGELVGVVIASDPDAGQELTFSIIGGNPEDAFQIDPVTGEIIIVDNSLLDFNANPVYYLSVHVQDNGLGNLTNQAIVSVAPSGVNQPPIIEDQVFTVEENCNVGEEIGLVIANDPDVGQTLTYSIIAGNTYNTFEIGSISGILSVADSSALNYEEHLAFNLLVQVQDDGVGNLTDQATVTINLTDVNENPNINEQDFTIVENSPNGQAVGLIMATDPDNGQVLTYSILAGNIDNAFQVGETTGILAIANGTALDFETYPEFNLVVQVEDDGQGNLMDQAIVTIILNDINEAPQVNPETFSIDENSIGGSEVGTVTANDPDIGQSISYSIVSGNTGNTFEIDLTSGLISVNNSAFLDFETYPVFEITVEAQDNGQSNLTGQGIITINLTDVNENPFIGNQVFTIEEFCAIGEEVGEVEASDPDNAQTLTFNILSGNTDNAFQLNSETGILTVNNCLALDFAVNPVFVLSVEVQDDGSGNLSDTANIVIAVINMTDIGELPEIKVFSSFVYPNPASDFINVDMKNLSDDELSISIINMSGETMLNKEYSGYSQNLIERIETGKLNKGTYIISIINGNVVELEKFTKM